MAKKKPIELEWISTTDMSREEWLIKRQDGIGGSDMSAIMGMNPYFSNLELFYQKVGLNYEGGDNENAAMAWGTILEPVIREQAQYLDLTTMEFIQNWKDGIKLREIVEKKTMVRNPEFPWLLANVDGFENVTEMPWENGFIAERIAEIKTISSQAARKWEGGLPPYYIPQGHTYAIVCGPVLKEPETAYYVLEDGRQLWGVVVQEQDWMRDAVIEQSYNFWNSIVAGRELVANEKNLKLREKGLEELEPVPHPSDSCDKFMSELQKKKVDLRMIEGGQIEWDMALEEKSLKTERDAIEKDRKDIATEIKQYMRHQDIDVIDFGKEGGKVTFRGKFYNNIKL